MQAWWIVSIYYIAADKLMNLSKKKYFLKKHVKTRGDDAT